MNILRAKSNSFLIYTAVSILALNLAHAGLDMGKLNKNKNNETKYSWDYGSERMESKPAWERQEYTNERYWLVQQPGLRYMVDYKGNMIHIRTLGRTRRQAKENMNRSIKYYFTSTGIWAQVSIHGKPARSIGDALKRVAKIDPYFEEKNGKVFLKKSIQLVAKSYLIRAKKYQQQIEKASEISGIPVEDIYLYIHKLTGFNSHALGRNNRRGLMLVNNNWDKKMDFDVESKDSKPLDLHSLTKDDNQKITEKYNEDNGWVQEASVELQQKKRIIENKKKNPLIEQRDPVIQRLLIGIKRIKAIQQKYLYIKNDDARENVIYIAYAISPDFVKRNVAINKNTDSYYVMSILQKNVDDNYIQGLLGVYDNEKLRMMYQSLDWEYAKLVNQL